jgi:tripartite-type tricarboxylate transporter receptor subunit TctC
VLDSLEEQKRNVFISQWPAALRRFALAQEPYPNHGREKSSCRFAPGGATDITARLDRREALGKWGQPVVIENQRRAPAATSAPTSWRKAKPDGYTLLVGVTGSHASTRRS